MPPVRTNDFNEGSGIPAESANTELDRLTARQRDVRLRLQRTPVLTKSVSTTLAVTDAGQCWTNKNQTASLTYTLPVASMGLRFEFSVVEDFALVVAVNGGTDTLAGGTSLTCSVVGGYLEIVCTDDHLWSIKSKNGSWA